MTLPPRHPDFPVAKLFTDRWSPRAFTGETLPENHLLTMLEAARWSPSASNLQPWRFSYALAGTDDWERYIVFLIEFNQVWAKNAGALVIAVSKTHNAAPGQTEEKFTSTHSFDTGASTLAFQLQANLLGYHAHPMAGILKDKIKLDLGIPEEGYVVEAAIAVGRIAPAETLPEPIRAREVPSIRKPLADIAFKGGFKI